MVPKHEDDTNEQMDLEPKTELANSPTQPMPPPPRNLQHNTSQFVFPTRWDNYGSSKPFPNGFVHTPPYNAPFVSPKSEPSPKMSILAMLCDPTDPNVFTPPQYDTKSENTPIVSSDLPPDPPKTVVITREPVNLVTRTPPPLTTVPPLYKEFEIPDDSSDEDQDDHEIEVIPRSDADMLVPSSKRRRLNNYVPNDSYDIHILPQEELRWWDFYDKTTCRILSVKNSQGENPWRDDLIARAQGSEPLKHALFALSSFHIKRYYPDTNDVWQMANVGIHHTNQAFHALYKVMNDKKAFYDENNIAAMLVLSFSQVPLSHLIPGGKRKLTDRCGTILDWTAVHTFLVHLRS